MAVGAMAGSVFGPAGAGVGGTALPAIMQMLGHAQRRGAEKSTAKDIKALTDLIAVGGSKSALARRATEASSQVEKLIAGLRPALVAAAAPTAVAARDKPKPKPPQKRTSR